MVEAAIEDLAFPNRFSRESDAVRRWGCIEHDYTHNMWGSGLTQEKWQWLGLIMRSSAAAEKGGEGMALKIWREQDQA